MGLSSKWLNNTTEIEKKDFDNDAFKGNAAVYDDEALLAAYNTLVKKMAALKSSYGDVKKAYDKLLSCTTTGNDMNINKGLGKAVNKIKTKAGKRKERCDIQIDKINSKIEALEHQMEYNQGHIEKDTEATAQKAADDDITSN